MVKRFKPGDKIWACAYEFDCNKESKKYIQKPIYGIFVDETKMVEKRNFRNIVDMSAQRTCSRAYWEYRNHLMKDYLNALKNYSEEWNTLIDMACKPKCEKTGFCTEKNTCERRPRKGE